MSRITRIEQAYAKSDLPEFEVGDTVDVHVLIREGEKERVQVFNGTVIRRRGGGMSETYTVRRIVQGQGVERTFPLHSPFVEKIVVKRTGKVRRSRLYFLRERRGKATRLREMIGGRKRRPARRGVEAAVEPAPVPETPAAEPPPEPTEPTEPPAASEAAPAPETGAEGAEETKE